MENMEHVLGLCFPDTLPLTWILIIFLSAIARLFDPFIGRGKHPIEVRFGDEPCTADLGRGEGPVGDPAPDRSERRAREPSDVAGAQILGPSFMRGHPKALGSRVHCLLAVARPVRGPTAGQAGGRFRSAQSRGRCRAFCYLSEHEPSPPRDGGPSRGARYGQIESIFGGAEQGLLARVDGFALRQAIGRSRVVCPPPARSEERGQRVDRGQVLAEG